MIFCFYCTSHERSLKIEKDYQSHWESHQERHRNRKKRRWSHLTFLNSEKLQHRTNIFSYGVPPLKLIANDVRLNWRTFLTGIRQFLHVRFDSQLQILVVKYKRIGNVAGKWLKTYKMRKTRDDELLRILKLPHYLCYCFF